FGAGTKAVAAAVAAADPAAVAASLRERGSVVLDVAGEQVRLAGDELMLTESPRTGWSVATEAGETVALDLTITPELRRAGMAREVVRLVQEARKSSGLDISDRISLWWQATGATAEALAEHEAAVAEEVLATEVTRGMPGTGDLPAHGDPELGLTFWLR